MRELVVPRTIRRNDHGLLNLWVLIRCDIDDETLMLQPEV
jgi:hypothetical protein